MGIIKNHYNDQYEYFPIVNFFNKVKNDLIGSHNLYKKDLEE